MKIAEKS